MLLKIEVPSRYLVVPAVNAGPIVAALETAYPIESQGYGKDQKWVKAEEPVVCEFISEDRLKDKPEPLVKALANYEQAQNNWLAEYNKRCAAEKERDELKKKLESINSAVKT